MTIAPAQQIILEVPGIPRPQPRPRVTKTGHAFNPTTAGLTAWKASLRLAARIKAPREPWTQAVRVDVEAYFPRPPWLVPVLPYEALPMLERPDRDNLDKTILDTLTGLGYWGDDSQVFVGRLGKFYTREGYGPGAIVTVTFISLREEYLRAVEKHRGVVDVARGKREAREERRSRPAFDGSRIMNEQMSMEQLASEIAARGAGRKVRA